MHVVFPNWGSSLVKIRGVISNGISARSRAKVSELET
jgi:hypothetical protein